MLSPQEPSRVLSSWKEIASYLGIGVRTAQVWERDRGLPVSRLPGSRGQVWASTCDVDAWKASRPQAREEVTAWPRSESVVDPMLPRIGDVGVPNPVPLAAWLPQSVRSHWIATFAIVVAVVGMTVALGRGPSSRAEYDLMVTPLTSDSGAERVPDLHPDGSSVAFLTDGPDGGVLHLQPIDGPSSVLATGVLGFPRWSPDGRRISYSRLDPAGVRVVVRDLRNGVETPFTVFADGLARADNPLSSLMTAWLDDRRIVIAERPAPGHPYGLVLVDVAGSRHKLTTPPAGAEGDLQPAVSPGRSMIAFVRQLTFSEADVFVTGVSGGVVTRITSNYAKIAGIAWLSERELIFSSNRATGNSSLWRVPAGGGTPTLLTGGVGTTNFPRVAETARGLLIAYQHHRRDSNVWRATTSAPPVPVIRSTWLDFNPAYSHDGAKIAFISKRTGHTELWTANPDGTEPRQITHLQRGFTDSPRWSPDGEWIAFTSVVGQNRDVFVTPSSGGPVRRITAWDSEEGRPSWSPDGKTIYFRSDKSGRRELWMAAFPQGEPVPVTKTGAYEAFAALDGSLYLVRGRDEHGLWRHSAGGRPELVIPGVREGRWSMTAHGIVYQDFPGRTIKKYAFATRKTTHLLDLPGAAPIETGLSASPDGNAVLFTQTDEDTVDIMLARLRP